jgi:hypothetical protein
VTLALGAVGLAMIPRLALVELAVAVVYLYLMTRWFFVPRLLSGNRILALATHCPFSLLVYLYVARASAQFHGLRSPAAATLVTAAWMVLPFLSYEFARKTMMPDEERPGLQTYSSMLGFRVAGAISHLFVAAHVVVVIFPLSRWRRPPVEVVVGFSALLGIYTVVLLAFLTGRLRRGKALEVVSGVYYMGTLLLLLVGLLRHG